MSHRIHSPSAESVILERGWRRLPQAFLPDLPGSRSRSRRSFQPEAHYFSAKPMMRRQLCEGNAGRLPGILQTKAAAKTSLTSRASAAKTASPRLAGWKRSEQRLGHLCGPIDGVSIAVNPRNDEAPCTTVIGISASSQASTRLASSPSAWASPRAPTWPTLF